jgi:hypothetical protein
VAENERQEPLVQAVRVVAEQVARHLLVTQAPQTLAAAVVVRVGMLLFALAALVALA